ncbi:SAM-dependent methyltransferase [Actinoallomurus sp. NPDC052308]|uniref:SAM-dependent methyltransferase n=1 Tax=Actinoallomurus sp. NPDC052308 TaxID=3155530 RepID=UPI003443D1D5
MEARVPDVIDVHTPSPARMYDYWLGGKDNFAADREAAEKVIAAHPEQRKLVRANRDFLVRVVRHLAEQGVEQFLDLGTGIPTSPNVHEVAREIRPAARVVYVDNDPIVFAHNRAFRATDDRIATVRADIRRPREILGDPAVERLLDFDRPIALLAIAVLHFVPEGEEVIGTLRENMAPGSFLALSTGTYEGLTLEQRERIENAYAKSSAPAVIRSRTEIERLFTGFDLVEPGLVHVARWRSDGPETKGRLLAGVGRLGTSSPVG